MKSYKVLKRVWKTAENKYYEIDEMIDLEEATANILLAKKIIVEAAHDVAETVDSAIDDIKEIFEDEEEV